MNNILIIKIASLGDVLRTTCILPGLHKKYANSHIDWLTSPDAVTLLVNNPLINEVLNQGNFFTSRASTTTYDLVINLEDDVWACEFAVSIPAVQLIGAYAMDGARTYTSNSANWFDLSLISRYGKETADQLKKKNLRTYPSLLFEMLDISPGTPSLKIPDRERNFALSFAERYLTSNQLVIGLNTGAGARWRYKRLSEEKSANLVDLLTNFLGATVILFGGPTEIDRNRSIQNLSNNIAINAGNDNSLLEFSAKIALCDVLITSDSLALHIASCLDIPIVPFFGPTSATEIELFGRGKKIIPKMKCICCYKQDCDFQPTCMDNISTDEILDAIKGLLSTSS
jgi:heptosyltransferase-2